MRRILSVWLPRWPITRLNRGLQDSSARPLVTVETIRGVRCLAAVGVEGEAQGLAVGQTLTAARAICPALHPTEAAPAADTAALLKVAAWCERYTPMVAVDAPDGLWLDVTGCLGSEAELVQDLAGRLQRTGIGCRMAIASTTGAAWALAHADGEKDRTILPPRQEMAALADLPLASLRLQTDTILGLRRLGLRTVRELVCIPRAEITARFGHMPVLRLDQALGLAKEALEWLHPLPAWSERLPFAEPIFTPEDLARALTRLAEQLCERLARQEKGGKRFLARFFRVDNTVAEISLATALPVHDASYLSKLLQEKLESIDPGFGIEAAVLGAETVASLRLRQVRLADPATDDSGKLSVVIDALTNRASSQRIWRVAPFASHVPERAVQRVPPLVDRPSWVGDPAVPRPIRLLQRPEAIEATALVPDEPPIQFRWRGALHRVRAATGPERISAEWWRGKRESNRAATDLVRDYYQVEDAEGARFWIFRAGLHGGERRPRWYLHGLFA